MQQFKGRVVVPGTCTAEALVSHGGFNTLASYQMAMMFGDKQVKCGDQNNPDIYKKPMIGKALCLPQTIGSTTGGMVLFTVMPALHAPTASNILESEVSTPSTRPDIIGPPEQTTVGMFILSAPRSIPGTILSQFGTKTRPSKP